MLLLLYKEIRIIWVELLQIHQRNSNPVSGHIGHKSPYTPGLWFGGTGDSVDRDIYPGEREQLP